MEPDATQLAQTRAQGDSRIIKRVLKDFYRLFDAQLLGEELEAAHETFLLDLGQLTKQLGRSSRLKRVTETEVQGYEEEARSIEAMQLETEDKIAQLRVRLEHAQRDRARAIEYDAIAKSVSSLPDRPTGLAAQEKLVNDIAALKEEQKVYQATWQTRKHHFDGIVSSLVNMTEAIAEEKNEQERRTALDDDNLPAEESSSAAPLDPTAEPFEPSKPNGTQRPSTKADNDDDAREEGETDELDPEEERRMHVDDELEEGQEREVKEKQEMETEA